MTERHGPTAAQMIESGGMTNFVRAIRFASRYSAACKKSKLARPLTLKEYMEEAGVSRAHAFKEQVAWRACVGESNILEVLATAAILKAGWTEDQREAAIVRFLDGYTDSVA